jgi:membrane-associated phospholipid phosphatase
MKFLLALCVLVFAAPGFGQKAGCGLAHPGECFTDVVRDQAGVWTSPARLKKTDAKWLVPLAGAAALAFHFDTRAVQGLGNHPMLTQRSQLIARFGSPFMTAGAGGGLYALGLGLRNRHLAKTGRLSAEAVVDASLVVGALKLATDRQRIGNGQSGFWPGGRNGHEWNSSFPSGHAAASWAMASVLAHEYPKNRAVQIAAYGFATAISVCRFTGKAHFPSDVVVGSTFGYLIGRFVVRRHGSEVN